MKLGFIIYEHFLYLKNLQGVPKQKKKKVGNTIVKCRNVYIIKSA